jgi:hypothetical protein
MGLRRLIVVSWVAAVALLAPAAAQAATGSLVLVGAKTVNPVFRASVTLTQSDCDAASGYCGWTAYATDQPRSQGRCPATSASDDGPVAPDYEVDMQPEGDKPSDPEGVLNGPGTQTWQFTVPQALIPGRYRVCLYVVLPDDTTSNPLIAEAAFVPPVACDAARNPVTHIRHDRFSAEGLRLAGIAEAHCPRSITRVGVSIARVTHIAGRSVCSFLTASHRWTPPGSCTPRDYLTARGTATWTFALALRLRAGVYHLWERAVDSRRVATHNTSNKYVFFRIR